MLWRRCRRNLECTVNIVTRRRHMTSSRRRVVATGMGLVTCLGRGVDHVWTRLVNAECGLRSLDDPAYAKIPCRVAGLVPHGVDQGEVVLDEFIPKQEQKSMSLASCYARIGAQEALEQAGWFPKTQQDQERTGVAVGMGMVGLDYISQIGGLLEDRGYNRVPPYFIPKVLINMAAGHISIKYGFKGVNHAVSTACTTGVHAIGDAMRFIQHADCDVMVCGGTEASVSPLSIAGFARMRALSTKFNDSPQEASRPFDRDRDGFVMADGAGILVLEEYEHARNRGASMYAEILGYGLSSDGSHITAPSADGDGAYRCMHGALINAGVGVDRVGYINAHATSTPLGDSAETQAISRLCGNHCAKLAVSSTKGSVGHLLGAAGSVEAIFTIKACHTGTIPPTLNCHNPDTIVDLNYVPLLSQKWTTNGRTKIALTNSFGFGGTNASLCISSIA